MKTIIRYSNQNDLDNIYNLHKECFKESDCWYKPNIAPYLEKGLVIEMENKKLIGILLQGDITPCNKKLDYDNYDEEIFEPINDFGKEFLKDNNHYDKTYGIVMICIHPKYRNRGLAQKLVQKHIDNNINNTICLNTRRSNINAYKLYKKMGYNHIAFIKNKYYLPVEDSIFMVYKKNENLIIN